jgi:argininosuccinate synthase
VLLTAHRDLERLVLSRQELAFKQTVDEKWSELGYMGLVHEPLFAALGAFISTTQQRVNGTVDVTLYKGSVIVKGRSSVSGLYSDDLVSFDTTTIDQTNSIGFSSYFGLQARLHKNRNK